MNLLKPKYILAILVIMVLFSCAFAFSVISKKSFIKGLWISDEDSIYLLISDIKPNGRYGAYIIKDKPTTNWDNNLDTNEIFEMGITFGPTDGVQIITFGTDKLPKSIPAKIDIAKGILTISMKGKKVVLYKDIVVSNNI